MAEVLATCTGQAEGWLSCWGCPLEAFLGDWACPGSVEAFAAAVARGLMDELRP
jgi:hypothetical protein